MRVLENLMPLFGKFGHAIMRFRRSDPVGTVRGSARHNHFVSSTMIIHKLVTSGDEDRQLVPLGAVLEKVVHGERSLAKNC